MPRNYNAGVRSILPTTPTLTEKFRRNGKLQSCEPCRKSKLKCDHIIPACGRCVKRGRVGQCYYHPNPLTQTRQIPTKSLPTPTTSTASQASPHAVIQSREFCSASPGPNDVASTPAPFNPSSEAFTQGSPGSGHAQCQPFHRAASAPPLDYPRAPEVRRNTGFFGPTSYSNILSEGLGILEPVAADLEATAEQQKITITHERITQGCKVLSFFRNRSMINRYISRWYEVCEGTQSIIIESIMKEWLLQLWIHHGAVLMSQDPDKIRRLSVLIWRNTLTPLQVTGKTTALEWARLATGPNLRWETLGLIAANIGLCAIETPPSATLFVHMQMTRSCVIRKMKDISEECLIFCRYCEVLDDMFIWLLLEDSALVCAVKGDKDYATWRATGEAHSAVTAIGLHQGIKAGEDVPFFLAQLRKRSFICAYFQEISLASFLGRPPRLSYRYCTVDPPLDLTDKQLIQTGPELAATLANLDKDGYNTAGALQHAGWLRSYTNVAMRREDVVDLALGNYTREEILARAKIIQDKIDGLWSSLPPFMEKALTRNLDFANGNEIRALETLQIAALRNGSGANDLLLQRVLIRKTGATSEKLITTARTIFRDILQITQRHDIAARFQSSFNFLLCSHGLRSAAIVAIELLKQEMLPVYPERPLLPRSQTIQDLAIFAARLDAVSPSDGSYSVCEQGKRVITKILDRILSPQGARQNGASGNTNCCGNGYADAPGQFQSQSLAQETMLGQKGMGIPTSTIGLVNGLGMAVPDMGYGMGMMDVGIGVEAPMSLGQDIDFMEWLEGMNWERMNHWSM